MEYPCPSTTERTDKISHVQFYKFLSAASRKQLSLAFSLAIYERKPCNCRELPESVRFRALVIRRPQISGSRVGNNFGVIGMSGPPFVLSRRFMQADVPRMCCITVLRRGRGRCTKKAVCSTSSVVTRQRGGVVSTHLRLMKH